jgi:hypothetical protein
MNVPAFKLYGRYFRGSDKEALLTKEPERGYRLDLEFETFLDQAGFRISEP